MVVFPLQVNPGGSGSGLMQSRLKRMIRYSLVGNVSWIKQQAPRLYNPAMFSQLLLPCAV